MKKVIKVMVENCALSKYNGNSQRTAPTFSVPKKNDKFRIVTGFCKLNEAIQRNPWPMPAIQDMLHQCGAIVYATTLAMIMTYYAIDIPKNM